MPPKAKAKAKAAAAAPPPASVPGSQIGRIQNARQLRKNFIEIKQSPEGLDADPLTVPKCVECPYCKFPVFPRKCKPATKRTFERAGVDREGNKREEEPDKAEADKAAGEGDAAAGGEAEDDGNESADTQDQMYEKIELLEEENDKLKAENQQLTTDLDIRTKELEVVQKELEETKEFLEEARRMEAKWRKKCNALRKKLEEEVQRVERFGTRIGDLESDVIRKLLEIRGLRQLVQKIKRRRALMLNNMEDHIRIRDDNERNQLILGFWRGFTAKELAKRAYAKLDEQRIFEVNRVGRWLCHSLNTLNDVERDRQVQKDKLKAAARRLLERSLGHKMPHFGAFAFTAWTTSYHVEFAENALKRTTNKLSATETALSYTTERREFAEAERDLFHKQREEARLEAAKYAAEVNALIEQLQKFGAARAGDMERIKREAEEKARRLREAFEKKLRAEMAFEMAKLKAELEEERQLLEDQINGLEAQLKIAKSQKGGGSGFGEEDPNLDRVVPKGQGVLCCGCMRQLLHRKVQPIAPAAALKGPSHIMDVKKQAFFESELHGMPDPDDPIHSYMWASHKDPTGLTRYGQCVASDPSWARRSLRSPGKVASLPDLLKDFKGTFR